MTQLLWDHVRTWKLHVWGGNITSEFVLKLIIQLNCISYSLTYFILSQLNYMFSQNVSRLQRGIGTESIFGKQ